MDQAQRATSLTRCLLVLLLVTAGVAAVGSWLLSDLLELGALVRRGAVGDRPFDEVLVEVSELAVTGCAAWLWSATAVIASDAARGRTSPRRCVPNALHAALLAAFGVALLGGLGAPAHAGDTGSHGHGARPSLVDGLPLPDRATTAMHVSAVFARAESHRHRVLAVGQEPAVVVVRPGDTLWHLARADLPLDATNRAVADRVREIYDANRAAIGTDPDLIRPGQRLRMPPTLTRR